MSEKYTPEQQSLDENHLEIEQVNDLLRNGLTPDNPRPLTKEERDLLEQAEFVGSSKSADGQPFEIPAKSAAILPTLPTPGSPSINMGLSSSGMQSYTIVVQFPILSILLYYGLSSVLAIAIIWRISRRMCRYGISRTIETFFLHGIASTFRTPPEG